jgi:thiamine-phosphate pyrophosphorylase
MLRLIDANINRLNEGLRLLEDVARFLLDDEALSTKLKALRHELSEGIPPIQKVLLSARDAEGDVTAFAEEDMKREDVPAIVGANARRATESLRVLEEFAKLPDSRLDPERFKRARFAVYEIERELAGKVLRQEKRIAGLYVIIDPDALGGKGEVEACRQAIRGGARVVQLRDKTRYRSEVLNAARKLKEACAPADVPLIINDYVDIAIASAADGVHLGDCDLPVTEARRLVPIDTLIGRTTRTVEQAVQAEVDGADYVAVGSMYPTSSKEQPTVVGIERLRQIRDAVSLPMVAIGGINADNVSDVIDAGADAVAVMSAVIQADDVERAARSIAEKLEVA